MPAPRVVTPPVVETEIVLNIVTTVPMNEGETIVVRGREFYPRRRIEAGSTIKLMPKQGQKKIYWVEAKKFDDGTGELTTSVKQTSGITYTDEELGV